MARFPAALLRRRGLGIYALGMTTRALRPLVASAVLAGALWAAAPEARAQNSAPRPPEPKIVDDAPVLRTYFVLAVIAALVIGANTIPSKRGHQD